MRCLWSLHMSLSPITWTSTPSRNVNPTSWFILSVLFLTVGETSVVPTHVRDPPSHGPPPSSNVYLNSWFILSVLFFTGGETSVVPTCIRDPPSHGSPPQKKHLPDQLIHSVCVVFDRQRDICGPYTCLGSPVTLNSTVVGTST